MIIKHLNTNVFALVNAGDFMGRFTISISKEMKAEMDSMSGVNWPEIAKVAILKKLDQLEKFDKMVKKGEL
jgi:hypothetical protein